MEIEKEFNAERVTSSEIVSQRLAHLVHVQEIKTRRGRMNERKKGKSDCSISTRRGEIKRSCIYRGYSLSTIARFKFNYPEGSVCYSSDYLCYTNKAERRSKFYIEHYLRAYFCIRG